MNELEGYLLCGKLLMDIVGGIHTNIFILGGIVSVVILISSLPLPGGKEIQTIIDVRDFPIFMILCAIRSSRT
jgi:hypothetical protein